ncbi:MAG TPA: insulinase family protein [Syntrophales bacterium]|nr:insulinase family protein [Syntrophales bacterium]
MTVSDTCPIPTLAAGQMAYGFRVLRVELIPEIRITAYEMEHVQTGAKILHLHCDDRENLYSVGFRTPPENSTGVPHILEHSVLAGSERYPLRDVFNELHRGTLQTFINAFTYPDKTIYPVASQVRADFFNLARVYTDLVLRPRLLKETFYQEGHHFEFSNPEDTGSELIISGIVFNEMKGVYSSPEALMYKVIQQHLYPDTPYSFDSGGNPDDIPHLSYEQFKAFHRAYYSATNARFFIYGDIPTADHLVFLAEMLAGFDRVEVASSIRSQPRWQNPLSIQSSYPIAKDDNPKGKTAVNVAWMMAENVQYETALLLQIISGMLVGSAAGPLRKALIDSGLGEDLSPLTGLESDFKQIAFVVGLRGTDPDKGTRIEALIIDTLKNIAKSGFDRALIEGTLHQVEFNGKEIVRSAFPYGIMLMGRVYHTWLYDGDPLEGLNFPRAIENVRNKWAANPELFQETVQKWFLDNPHRLLSVTEPSTTYQADYDEAFKKKMALLKASLSVDKLESIREDAVALKKFQVGPDAPAAELPRLSISDISRSIETIPTTKAEIENVPVLMHDIFANGIAYLDLAFDVSDLQEDLQLYLPLLAKLIANMGAAGLNYEEMAKRIILKTGGIGYHLCAGMTVDGKKNWQKLIFRVKALQRNISGAVDIISDILTKGDMSDEARMRELIAERKNDLHASVIPSGHTFARRSAGQALSTAAYRDEQWHGRTQFKFVNMISDEFQEKRKELMDNLTFLQQNVFRKDRLYINLTADAEGLSLLRESSANFVRHLLSGGGIGNTSIPVFSCVNTGITIPAHVSYVAKVLQAPAYGDALSAPMFVLARQLSNGYLYKRIRVQGGAYGGMSQYDPMSGIFALLSYRDPNIIDTLNVYREAEELISQDKISGEELEKTVIGTIGSLDKPMDPSNRGYIAMIRDFTGLTDEDRLKFRHTILDMTPELLQEAASHYFAKAASTAVIAVYSSYENLQRANEHLEPKLEIEPLI